MTKTEQEQIRHSEDLERDETIYGQGPATGYEIDLGFKDNGKGMDSWTEGTEFFRNYLEPSWDGHSAGTGFGTRDMQFARQKPLTKQEFDTLVKEAKSAGIVLEYLNQYGTNEWGEPVKEDASFTFTIDG